MEPMQYTQGTCEMQIRIIRENLAVMRQLTDKASARLGDSVTDDFFRRVRRYCDGVAELADRLSAGADVDPVIRNGKNEEDAFLPSDLLS